MRILGLDASGPALAVGILDGDRVVADWYWMLPKTAGSHLVGWIDELTRQLGRPDAIAVGAGPGSFTGVRIAVMAAKMLAWTWELPLRGVSSLEAWAWGAQPGPPVLVTSERRGKAFYAGYYWIGGDGAESLMADMAVQDRLPAPFPVAEPIRVVGAIADDGAWLQQVGPGAIPTQLPCYGSNVAKAARRDLAVGKTDDCLSLLPRYIKAPAIGYPRG